MERKRFIIQLNGNMRYVADDVIGLFKGVTKGDAKCVGIYEEDRKLVFSVKHGFESAFVGQTQSYGFNVKESNHGTAK